MTDHSKDAFISAVAILTIWGMILSAFPIRILFQKDEKNVSSSQGTVHKNKDSSESQQYIENMPDEYTIGMDEPSYNSSNKESKSGETATIRECNIKGNISYAGEKIYHLPGQKYYNKTSINIEQGERYFCSESEAISAGWRKSKI